MDESTYNLALLCTLLVLGASALHVAANLWLIAVALRTAGAMGLLALFPWPIPFLRSYWAVQHWENAREPYKLCHITLGGLLIALGFFARVHFEHPTEEFPDPSDQLTNLRLALAMVVMGLIYLWANFEVHEYHANTDLWYYAILPGYSIIWIILNREMLKDIPIIVRVFAFLIMLIWLFLPDLQVPSLIAE